jgi:hypothetical protein
MDVRQVVVVPGGGRVTRVTDAGATEIPLRVAERLDDLAGELGALLGTPGSVVDRPGPAPGQGSLVVCSDDLLDGLAESGADMRWVIGIGLPRLQAVRLTAGLGLAAGVRSDDLSDWASDGRGGAVVGRADVAVPGAVVATDLVDAFGGYALLTVPGVADLPTILASYVRAAP